MKKAICFVVSVLLLLSLSLSLSACGPVDTNSALLNFCNAQRTKNGISELVLDEDLCEQAYIRAKETAQQGELSHIRPDGSGCLTVITGEYSFAGENLACAAKLDAKEIVKSWMSSEEHKSNILSENFTSVGFGIYEADGKFYIAQLFKG